MPSACSTRWWQGKTAVSPGAWGIREAALAATVTTSRRDLGRLLRAADVRHQHSYRTGIKHRKKVGGRCGGNADQRGNVRGARRHKGLVNCQAVERRMLLIDYDEIVPQVAKYRWRDQ
jgi:hypothetical protein